jgi:Inner membrane component of T3SS, cytoplasmic domain
VPAEQRKKRLNFSTKNSRWGDEALVFRLLRGARMEENASPLPDGDQLPPAPGSGELVVQNGRHAGTRRPLRSPLTLIGRTSECDVRLVSDAVAALHCALFPTAAGIVLRDLGSGTKVNDEPVETGLLQDGDILSVGPFQFRIRWEASSDSVLPESVARRAELEALRIQAAAVAAQQAALLEEESRLQQRQSALEKQEDQLVAHLEERRKTLLAMQDEVRQEKAQLQQERAAFEQERRSRLEAIDRDQADAVRLREQAERERRRFVELRKRYRRRWRRHWGVQEKALGKRTQELTSQEVRFQADRTALDRERLRFNGERELGRRQLQDAWVELRKTRREWEAQRRRSEADLKQARRELAHAQRTLAGERRTLAAQQAQALAFRTALEKESEGLENRVRNLRQKLSEHERDLTHADGNSPSFASLPSADPSAPLVLSPPLASASPTGESVSGCLAQMESLAGDLADQRRYLAEQWERFLQVQQAWHEEHTRLFPDLEEAARRLGHREDQIREQEMALDRAAAELLEKQQGLAQFRGELEAWQARLTANESAWRNEKAALLTQIHARETLVARRQQLLENLRQRWAVRRKSEFEQLSRELRRCREIQRFHAELRAECERRAGTLGVEERALAERALALDQFQLELAGRTDNVAAAEKKIQKLRRQIAAQHAEAERCLSERRTALEIEADRLKAQAHHLQQRAETLLERETTLSSRQTEWEYLQLQTETAQATQEQDLERLRHHLEAEARHRRELQDEIDRVVRSLLEEVQTDPPPWFRAA